MLFVNTVLLLVAYLVCVRFFPLVTMIVFTAFSTVFVFLYVIYNRGFSRKNLKIEDLPNDWTDDRKHEFLADGARRLERSKWMLTVIVPIIVVYAYEIIDIFILPAIADLIGLGV